MTANLHLRDGEDNAQVHDHDAFTTLRVGDIDTSVTVYAPSARAAREVADSATAWAELAEARERGEHVELWGTWVVPADAFGGAS
jgi:hypothetical protein